jgi:folate-binding protein YgfZ
MHDDPATLLASGTAFADLSSWRKVGVTGSGAFEWLNDVVTADVSALVPGRACRSLLLSPTGRVRAEFAVARPWDGLVLIQDHRQPRSVMDLLSPYVLSSDVTLEDRTRELGVFAFPGRQEPPDGMGTARSVPSCLGRGSDAVAPGQDLERLRARYGEAFVEATDEDVERWRVAAGIPRFGVDATDDDLPQEAGFAGAVSFDKGCYLGQEAVAKVQNLGHPRRLLMHLRADGPVAPGDVVVANGSDSGRVTSAAASDGGALVLARVGWTARGSELGTAAGVRLVPADAR